MGSKRVDRATWDLMLASHHEVPGNHSRAAKAAGVTRKTSRLAWDTGYPNRPWGEKPMRTIIEEEATIARARTELAVDHEALAAEQEALAAEANREAERQQAIRSRQMEAAMINGLRGVTSQTLAACIKALPGLQTAMARMGEELTRMCESAGPLSHKEVVSLSSIMRRYSGTLRELSSAGQTAMEMERLYLGEPTSLVGVLTEYDSMPMEELVRAANLQEGLLKRAAERGLVVIDGGLSTPLLSKTNGVKQ